MLQNKKNIVKKLKLFFIRYKKNCFIGFLIAVTTTSMLYDEYIDETVKKEVLAESKVIQMEIDGKCEIVHRNENRIIAFCADIIVEEEKDVKSVERYLLRNGYKRGQYSQGKLTWKKNKFYIFEYRGNDDKTIFTVNYGKKIMLK